MRTSLLERLLCPHCGGPLVTSMKSPAPADQIDYGILSCGCADYPVVAGIPIVKAEGRVDLMKQTKDSVWQMGPDISELVAFLRAGQDEKALLSLLVLPQRLAGRLLVLAGCVTRSARKRVLSLADRLWSKQQQRDRKVLLGPGRRPTALDLIDYYYRRSLRSELFNHFVYMFGQPRHLAGLALASTFPDAASPILDLACGFGHYMHYWTAARAGRPVVGVDRNFFQLYVAKACIASEGDFVCSEADERLPFRSETFSGVFCSDAFHCFLGRWQCAAEMRRIVEPLGVIVVSRFGNRQVEPREGYELTVDGYARLFDGLPMRLLSEEEVLRAYLQKVGPPLARPACPADLSCRKWLSLVASRDESVFRDYPEFESWPHALGRPRVNPLYEEVDRDGDGNVRLEFRFPSEWYAFENSACTEYMPEKASVSREVFHALAAGMWSEDMEALIRQCVIVGTPEDYL